MKIVLTISVIFQVILLSAQKEDYNWIFNFSSDPQEEGSVWGPSILDFNEIPPKAYINREIEFDFGKSNHVISDSTGNILFYSNAMSIFGKNHQPVINGDTINYGEKWEWLIFPNHDGTYSTAGFRTPQMITSVPFPGKSNEWLILYQNYEDHDSTGFYELRMATLINQEGTLELIEKDVVIANNIFKRGGLTACQHANGRDWWLLQFGKNEVYSYLIDQNGIKLYQTQDLPFSLRDTNGQHKFNRQGTSFAFYGWKWSDQNGYSDVFFSNFDRATGELINPQIHFIEDEFSDNPGDNVSNSSLNNGVAFSPDGKLLYICSRVKVFQYDVQADDIFQSQMVVGEYDAHICEFDNVFHNWFGIMQLAPDNKIYISVTSQCFELHRINYPNKRGPDCDVEVRAFNLPTYCQGTVNGTNTLRLGPIDGSPADTLGIDNHPVAKFTYEQDSSDYVTVDFIDLSFYRPENWLWDFGDGMTSTDPSPTHVFPNDGVYEVCLTVSNENSSSSACDTLHIGTVSTNELSFDPEVSIFPNPVADYTRIAFHNYLPRDATIIFYNGAGQLQGKEQLSGLENVIDLSYLRSGSYGYEVVDNGVVITNGSLIKL